MKGDGGVEDEGSNLRGVDGGRGVAGGAEIAGFSGAKSRDIFDISTPFLSRRERACASAEESGIGGGGGGADEKDEEDDDEPEDE